MLLTLVRGASSFRLHNRVVDVALRPAGLLRDRRDRLLARQPGGLADADLPDQLVRRQLDRGLGSTRDDDGDLPAHAVCGPRDQRLERPPSYLLMRLRQL